MAKSGEDIPTPDGWAIDEVNEERRAFCPDHAAVEPFTHDQCPGCVGGWGECGMWRAFAYSDRRNRSMTDADFASLGRGVCPRRTNGTFVVNNVAGAVAFEDMDLSERSPAGAAFAQAIRDYIERWPTQPDWPPAPWGSTRDDESGRTWEWHGRWEVASR